MKETLSGTGMRRVRVFLVDDHESVLDALKLWLEQKNRAEVVGTATNGDAALQAVSKLQPELILMDLAMPGLNGTETARAILKQFPAAKIIIYSGYSDPALIKGAIAAGASGFVQKAGPLSELWSAICSVMQGKKFFQSPPPRTGQLLPEPLTPRQHQVLKLIASGFTSREIASQLKTSARTVEAQRNTVMAKLHIHSIAGLTKYAVASGIICP